MDIKAEIKISDDLKDLGDRAESAVEAGLLRAAGAVEATAVEEAPKARGNLADSIRKYIEGSRAVIAPQARYAFFVHEGTGIYGPYKTPIVPKTKKALAFRIGGKTIIRRSVKGQKANPFMARALRKVISRLPEIFAAGFNSAIKS
jgi:HK97 gp10 family phage protein